VTATAVVSTVGLLVASCGGSNVGDEATPKLNEVNSQLEPDDRPTVGGKLVVAVPAETNGWNPAANQWADAGSLEGPSMIEPLVLKDANGEPEPYLATKWAPNADYTQWDITVRDDVEFHNGDKLTAEVVKANIEFSYTMGLAAVSMKNWFEHVEVTGTHSVRVFLKKAWAQYPSAMNTLYMMAPAMVTAEDKGTMSPVGTGPFAFSEWKQGTSLKVKRFERYWRHDKAGRQLPYLDEIEFRPIPDHGSMEKAMQAKDVDFALTTSAKVAANLKDDHTVLKDYTSERTLIMLQTDEAPANAPNPFTNQHARKALAYATDRDYIADLIGEEVQVTTQGYRPDSKWGLPAGEDGYVDFDPDKARAEIEAYKKDTGRDDLTFTVIGLPDLQDQTMLQALQAQWKEVGMNMSIETIDQVKYISHLILGQWDAAYMRWYGNPNPDGNFGYHSSGSVAPIGQLSVNFTHYDSPGMDQNLVESRQSVDFETRKAANDRVIREANEQAINIWLFDTPYAIVTSTTVRGLNSFRTHPFGNFTPKPWWGEVWVQQ
jgi:peptide/nickel transport system substrate-binding protein